MLFIYFFCCSVYMNALFQANWEQFFVKIYVTDYYTSYGSTVNVCALDLSKAFDKMNHHGLFMKLMERRCLLYTSDAADE